MAKFKIGDKVIAKNGAPYGITTNGWTGKVVGTLENPNGYEIWCGDIKVENEEDGPFSVESKYFDLVNEPQKIVITTDGVKTTTARLYEGKQVIKTAIAKCSPDDKFNFSTGAKIAFNRLFGALEDSFPWDEFIAGKVYAKVNYQTIDKFLKNCDAHKLKWNEDNKATDFNLYDMYKKLSEGIVGRLFVEISDIVGGAATIDRDIFIVVDKGFLKFKTEQPEDVKIIEII